MKTPQNNHFKPGTFGLLINSYRKSQPFKALADTSRETYGLHLDKIEQMEIATRRWSRIGTKDLRRLLVGLPVRSARTRVSLFRTLGQLAIDLTWCDDDHNPAALLKLPKVPKGAGYPDLPEHGIMQFYGRWPSPATWEGRCFTLGLQGLFRREDLMRVGWNDVDQKDPERMRIIIKPHKTWKHQITAYIPVTAAIDAAIHAAWDPNSKSGVFLPQPNGEPYTDAGSIGNRMTKAFRKAGLRGYSLHSLRKAGARRLADAGVETKQIMAVGGWETETQVLHYIKERDRMRAADRAYDAVKTIVGFNRTGADDTTRCSDIDQQPSASNGRSGPVAEKGGVARITAKATPEVHGKRGDEAPRAVNDMFPRDVQEAIVNGLRALRDAARERPEIARGIKAMIDMWESDDA